MNARTLLSAIAIATAALGCDDDAAGAGGVGAGAGGAGAGAAASGGAPATGGGGAAPQGGFGGCGCGGLDPAPPGNALVRGDGSVVPLYPVSDPSLGTRAIGFATSGTTVTALDEHGGALWSADLGAGQLFGGFDFDADGVPDLGLARSEDPGTPCGGLPALRTWLDVARGRDGALSPLTAKADAICWNFSGTIYPTTQWGVLGVLFGPGPTLTVAPYYASTGQFESWDGAAFVEAGLFQYPSTAAYDAAYTADQPNAYGQGQSFVANAHVANGLALDLAGEAVTVFFTSSRVAAYRQTPLASDQLRFDLPFLTGGRTDIAGRNYGLVARDPGDDGALILIAGTSADTLRDDMLSGTLSADPWGQIERHVTVVDLLGESVDDRFFSYAHDGGDAFQYEGRVVYPDSAIVRTGAASRLAFNVYEGGKWRVHVTAPGATADAVVIPDRFLWDVRDLDQDGVDEWVLSPTRDPADPDVPGYYFAKWRTVLGHWDEVGLALVEGTTFEGRIPYLVPTFRDAARSTSRGFLYPVLTERRRDGSLGLLLSGPDGVATSLDLP